MVEEGIRAVTTSYGFNAIFQKELSDVVAVPVFTSSLMQVPLIKNMLRQTQSVGVINANSAALTVQQIRNAGIDDTILILIEGLEASAEWRKAFIAPYQDIDLSRVKRDLLQIASSLKKKADIGAHVLECTDLPPFSAALRETTGYPVFDIVTLVNYVYRALR